MIATCRLCNKMTDTRNYILVECDALDWNAKNKPTRLLRSPDQLQGIKMLEWLKSSKQTVLIPSLTHCILKFPINMKITVDALTNFSKSIHTTTKKKYWALLQKYFACTEEAIILNFDYEDRSCHSLHALQKAIRSRIPVHKLVI